VDYYFIFVRTYKLLHEIHLVQTKIGILIYRVLFASLLPLS
jgi:hypothetical protein